MCGASYSGLAGVTASILITGIRHSGESERTLKGTISISLTTDTPDSGSGMPDLGHDAYWLMKELPKLSFQANGKTVQLGDKYEISLIHTEAS